MTSIAPVASRPVASAARPARAPREVVNAAPDSTVYILAVALVFAIWRLQEVIPATKPLKLPVVSLLIGMIAFFMTRSVADLERVVKGPLKWVLVMAALAVVGVPFAIVKTYSANFLIFDFAPTLLLSLFVAASIRSERDGRFLLQALVLGGIIFCIHARFNSFRDSSGRPAGIIYYDANDLALLAATTAAVSFGLSHTSRKVVSRLVWLGCAAVLISCVMWTVSRGAFVALLALGSYVLLSPIMPAAKRGLVIGIAAAGIVVAGGQSYMNTMRTMLNPEEDYNFSGKSDNGRGEVWKRGRGYVWERPIFGAGVRNYTAAEGHSAYAKEKQANGRGHKWSRAHNSFLEIAVEMGIPGFLCFVALILSAIVSFDQRMRSGGRPLDDHRRMAGYLAAAMITFCVGGFFLSGEYWPLMYVIVGIGSSMLVLPEIARSRQSPASSPNAPRSAPRAPVAQRVPAHGRSPAPMARRGGWSSPPESPPARVYPRYG